MKTFWCHSLGRKDILIPVARAVLALGADGLMVETHNDPASALSDAAQQLSLAELEQFAQWLTGAYKTTSFYASP